MIMNPLAALIAILTFFLPPTLAVAHTGPKHHSQAQLAIDRGVELFRHGDVESSVAEFEKAIELDPTKRARKVLFRLDVTENRSDAEEAIWCFVCEAQLYGAAEARERFLKVGRDRRRVMREAYKMFKDGGDPEKFVNEFRRRPHDYFYGSLYAGLYYESQNEENEAKRHIVSAYKTRYAQNSHQYMTAVAKVHCQRRSWID